MRLALILALRTLESVAGLQGAAFGAPLGKVTVRARTNEPCGGNATEEEPEEARRRAVVVHSVHQWWQIRGGCDSAAVVKPYFGILILIWVYDEALRACLDQVCKVQARELNREGRTAADPSRHRGYEVYVCACAVRLMQRISACAAFGWITCKCPNGGGQS